MRHLSTVKQASMECAILLDDDDPLEDPLDRHRELSQLMEIIETGNVECVQNVQDLHKIKK